MADSFQYPGQELVLFQHATNWKKYFSGQIRKYIRGHVLELGAGIGATTPYLFQDDVKSWTLAEPDTGMYQQLREKLRGNQFPSLCTIVNGTIDSVQGIYDTILYIDVLEHIKGDAEELARAAGKLAVNGKIIVLSPAFQMLYSPFDKQLGHFRRYNKPALKKITAPTLEVASIYYLDSMGFFAGLANKILLRQKYPSPAQLRFWDKFLVPVSRVTDVFTFRSFGKTIIAVWSLKQGDLP